MRFYLNAFTLIELLIVVAIIAILAAIAVPNFLEAQIRAKVSRSKTDIRSIATAFEAYRVDSNNYPPFSLQRGGLVSLTTPIAYISSVPSDAFGKHLPRDTFFAYYQDAYIRTAPAGGRVATRTYFEAWLRGCQWAIVGRGPNLRFDAVLADGNPDRLPLRETTCDPTNGRISYGDIERFGP